VDTENTTITKSSTTTVVEEKLTDKPKKTVRSRLPSTGRIIAAGLLFFLCAALYHLVWGGTTAVRGTSAAPYPSGSYWASRPANTARCSGLPVLAPKVTISPDGTSCTVVLPQGYRTGLRTAGFVIKQGEKFSMETSNDGTAGFSSDHPCVGARGMPGWHDPYVEGGHADSVGGVEFGINSLASTFLAADYAAPTSATESGEFVFRPIDRPGATQGKTGGHTIIIHRIP
jgi:hypothetical protein